MKLLSTLAWLFASTAFAKHIDLPYASTLYPPGDDSEIVNSLCLTCHSSDYVTTQPPSMSRHFWQAIVIKMQKVYGAPIPDDRVGPIVNYLTKTFGKSDESRHTR